MSGNRPQFDLLLGGNEELPQDLTIMNFASARAQEVISITEEEPRKTGLVFQRLPRYMRRRVMSHNSKRMPRQLREAHIRQMEKSGLPPKSKRPSRKYRRRPSNLLETYNRRQRDMTWLETHIWHAKRFHMTSKWGYKLANYPNDKSSRACYRGAANHCIIQDISYYACIELKGSFEQITNGLKMLTRDECGLTFGAKAWEKGKREGSVVLFRHNSKYPFGAIGRVLFLWESIASPDDSIKVKYQELEADMDAVAKSYKQRTIWIWVHPSYYDEVKEELLKVFRMKSCSPFMSDGSNLELPYEGVKLENFKSNSLSNVQISNLKLVTNEKGSLKISCDIPCYEGSEITMALLKDTLVRFRLTGPLSQAVLRETLLLAPLKEDDNVEGISWWTCWDDVFRCQKEVWKNMEGMTSAALVPPNTVIGLTILDPRCNIPKKRTKAIDLDYISRSEIVKGHLPPDVSASPIWNPRIRDSVTTSRILDAEVNAKQSDNLVPGISECNESKESTSKEERNGLCTRVPVLLIQRPGSQDPSSVRLGFCAGWDVIAPAGWGKPLWLALVMRGARACGLREAEMVENIGFSQMLCWPPLPDTNADKVEMEQIEIEGKDKYFRLPPSKRPNFVKLGICSPFSCPWDILCHEWSSSAPPGSSDAPVEIFVLREPHTLRQMSEVIFKVKKDRSTHHNAFLDKLRRHDFMEPWKEEAHKWFSDLSGLSENIDKHCLVPIKVTVCRKGTIKDYAVICLPIQKDFKKCGSNYSVQEVKAPQEPINHDPNQEERKNLRKEHKQILLSLRRKRVRQNREADEHTHDTLYLATEDVIGQNPLPRKLTMHPAATEKMCEEYKIKMENLFLPPVTQVRSSCSREVAGYVTHGHCCFSNAKEIGIAYIVLPALISLLKTKTWNPELLVFVRSTHSTNYVPAMIDIITN